MLIANILEQIRRDIASFADPGSEVELSDRSISWTRSRQRMTARLIRRPSGFPDVAFQEREYSYTGFLASEALADLKDLAATIFTTSVPPSNFVPVYARLTGPQIETSNPVDAGSLIISQTIDTGHLPLSATRVLFVHGNAGTGKTSTLRHVARLQADRYLKGETETLLLYLDAQGKGLSQLEDVMARALQDLRARFTYHSVAALARRHCVVPIVDGFDELIGPNSAREAFSNLSQFLAQLDCEGALIASSRSAFIDYRTLHERAAELAASQNLSYEILPVEVLDWNDEAIDAYCAERSKEERLRRDVHHLMASAAGALVRKPFFLSKICDILLEGGNIDVSRDLPRQVVDAALARESSKLKDSRGKELLTAEQHRLFCETIADEMWSLGSPEIDCDTVRLLAELVADQFRLDPLATKMLIDRSIAHGLLSVVPGRFPEKRAFEHELFRFEFQASSLTKLLGKTTGSTKDYILRAELPLDVVSRVPSYGFRDPQGIAWLLKGLNELVASSPNSQYAATNAGSIAAALLVDRSDLGAQIRLNGFYLRSHDLGTCVLKESEILNCIFENVDLSRAQLINCTLTNSQFTGCRVGGHLSWSGTKTGDALFFSLRGTDGRARDTYDPSEIKEILRSIGALVEDPTDRETRPTRPVEDEKIAAVERLLTHARTHFYISKNDRWFQNNLAKYQFWNEIERSLRHHQLLEDVTLQKSGTYEPFMRLTVAPDRILYARSQPESQRTTSSAAAFWKELVT